MVKIKHTDIIKAIKTAVNKHGKIHLTASCQGRIDRAFSMINGELVFWFNDESGDTLTEVVE